MGQLEEGEGVAARLGDDPVADPRVERPGNGGGEQRASVIGGQAVEHHLRQALERRDRFGVPPGEHERHGLGHQPAGDEAQNLGGGPVEPLGVVDHADERALGRRAGHEAEDGHAEQERVRGRAAPQAEDRAHRVALGFRDEVELIEQRHAHLVQRPERQLRLCLHAGHTRHPAAGRPVDEVLQQRGLPDACLSRDHQGLAAPGTDIAEHPGGELGAALEQVPFPTADGATGTDLYIQQDKFRAVFAADVPRGVADLMAVTQRPIAAHALEDEATNTAWKTIESWTMVTTEDLAIPADSMRFMAERANSHTVEIDASHAVTVSKPRVVADLIHEAARATTG